ncbi:spermidine/putrescine ABC transporter substrate-binding protein [Nocardioides marmoriginsengisoli]|uniref:Spermidine/putrescine ABC transporter substrate-binding protein n=1 Tax=Nocardioides marmoriginsengisoli TaxID=661483 RepID=A0A3N0CIB2_9ACTN|nr:spermidine/putrescine ABC transporter substrate-binding protein [Nocardioides marmoriginsengisoli]RNL63217.1 spermidine/putrescine ABC transporter substrate-binding protein [Nocardioides marmoriginsengisoli]
MPGDSRISRRTVLKGAAGAAFGVGSLAALKLPFFGTSDRTQDPADCFAKDLSASEKQLIISNWPGYMDEDEPTTLQDFEKRTGIKVRYDIDVNDNNDFFAKVSNQLGSCESSKRDMFMLTDWMAARMIQVGWIQKLDAAKVPNLHANVIDALKAPGWDPGRDFSAPWQSGLTGIAYNKKKVKEVRSFADLLTRDDLKGRISLLSEMRDTMGFMLLINGADPSDFTDADWEKGVETLKKARGDGQIRAFTGNEYIQDLSAGNILACEAWSGDVAAAENEDLVFVTPEEGLMIWADNMLIPNLATHKENAEKWIDYYYEPEIAARLADYVYYICPVKGAEAEMEKIDPDLLKNKTLKNLIFPDEETLSRTSGFMALTEAQARRYEGDFSDVISG